MFTQNIFIEKKHNYALIYFSYALKKSVKMKQKSFVFQKQKQKRNCALKVFDQLN